MADVNKGTHFMRGVVKWASILTPNTTFDPTYQATLANPTQVNNFGEVINGDSTTILADFENRGFEYSVKEDKDTGEKCLFFKRKFLVKKLKRNGNGEPIEDADGKWIFEEVENDVPVLMDKDNNPIDVAIGNGSEVIIMYGEWGATNKFGDFKGLELKGLQVLNLQEYNEDVGFAAVSVADVEEF